MKTVKIFVLLITLSLTVNFYNAYCAGDGTSVIWRFADKHEYGQLEPSEFCYIAIKGNVLIMHWIAAADPETIDIYCRRLGGSKPPALAGSFSMTFARLGHGNLPA